MSGFSRLLPAVLLSLSTLSAAQSPAKASAGSAQHAAALAESGNCAQALPLLRKSLHQNVDRDLKKRLALDGLHCTMTHNQPYESLDFLEALHSDFPNDPEALYAATHAFSDLSVRASQDLLRNAPFSYQVHELRAEALESQGKWGEAAEEYRKILEIDPNVPGIHARLGRALLSTPNPSPAVIAEVKKNFEQELEIDPNNASSEYVLGVLAKQDGDSAAAVRHFFRATKLDVGFADAYLALGSELVAEKQFVAAIAPLEAYEKLAPDSPTGHYQLAMAYAGAGRKDDANREAALQRQSAQTLEQEKRRVQLEMQGGQTPDAQPK
ncbi:MAG TPA: tetratricopeptide repeat protein [Terriglobales bacterium]|nr:tetratricopeptide repeat protein [Terriglobales bacterium]